MKILVTGYTGQLGYDVVEEGLRQGLDMIGSGSADLDITKEDDVHQYLEKLKPDAVIHCAAYTAVDKAEDDRDKAWQVNVTGTKNLAAAAKKIDAKFLYISTDYVFDGKGSTPFTETDETKPVGYYGQTKLEGEKVVKQIMNNWFIVRISWVFGENGNNFVKTMLRLSETRNELNVVSDQYGSPTYTFDLAKLLVRMIQSEKYGTYHATNEGICTWADFSREIFALTNKKVTVNPIPTKDFPTKAERPLNSRMSTKKLEDNGFQLLPEWQEALKHYLKKIGAGVN